MTIADTNIFSPRVPAVVSTGAASDETLANNALECPANREGWERVIDDCLVKWGQDPSLLEDEDIVPPSLEIVRKACELAMEWRDQGHSPPLRVVPDTDGGISFERRDGDWFQSLNILEDGRVELATFHDCRLYSRQELA